MTGPPYRGATPEFPARLTGGEPASTQLPGFQGPPQPVQVAPVVAEPAPAVAGSGLRAAHRRRMEYLRQLKASEAAPAPVPPAIAQ